jgi:quercetin dioxygenase-like cupin family protein
VHAVTPRKEDNQEMQRLAVVQRDEGEPLSIGAQTMVVGPAHLLGGAYCVLDQVFAPHQLSPVHSHDVEDQVVWVLAGAMAVWVDGEQEEVGAGGFALRPAGLPHAMWNATNEPVRFLEITSPATRFEAYMRELSGLIDRGESSPERVAALARRNGITFHPDLTEQLLEGTDLTTDGAFWKEGGAPMRPGSIRRRPA